MKKPLNGKVVKTQSASAVPNKPKKLSGELQEKLRLIIREEARKMLTEDEDKEMMTTYAKGELDKITKICERLQKWCVANRQDFPNLMTHIGRILHATGNAYEGLGIK